MKKIKWILASLLILCSLFGCVDKKTTNKSGKINCPKCGNQIEIPLNTHGSTKSFTCSHCGYTSVGTVYSNDAWD